MADSEVIEMDISDVVRRLGQKVGGAQ